MNNDILKLLEKTTLVCDGGMGTMLQSSGIPVGACPEEWNGSHEDIIAEIHKSYYSAGADIVETNSFGGNFYRLKFYGFEHQVSLFNRRAAEIACSIRPKGKFVAGSIGPTGEYLEPLGELKKEDLIECYDIQIGALCEGGIDLLIIETMSDLEEAESAVLAAKRIAPQIPIVLSMTFQKSAAGLRTMMGVEPRDLLRRLPECGADVIGTNCGRGMSDAIEVIQELREFTTMPLIAQPNAGMPQWNGTENVYLETAVERAHGVRTLLQSGIQIVGGCCGTTPDHISATRKEVDQFLTAKNNMQDQQ